jgi:hypothetical protein
MDMPPQPNFTQLFNTEFAQHELERKFNRSKTEFSYEEGVAGAGEGVHGHAPATELNSLVVQLPLAAVFRGLKKMK